MKPTSNMSAEYRDNHKDLILFSENILSKYKITKYEARGCVDFDENNIGLYFWIKTIEEISGVKKLLNDYKVDYTKINFDSNGWDSKWYIELRFNYGVDKTPQVDFQLLRKNGSLISEEDFNSFFNMDVKPISYYLFRVGLNGEYAYSVEDEIIVSYMNNNPKLLDLFQRVKNLCPENIKFLSINIYNDNVVFYFINQEYKDNKIEKAIITMVREINNEFVYYYHYDYCLLNHCNDVDWVFDYVPVDGPIEDNTNV